jgi:hypothetical protein
MKTQVNPYSWKDKDYIRRSEGNYFIKTYIENNKNNTIDLKI